jgi:protein gp37
LNPEILACIKNPDGSSAIHWDLTLDRKRLTSKTMAPWDRKTVVLNDIFEPSHSDEQLDMLFEKIVALPLTQFVILTADAARMDEYMRRIRRLSESSYRSYPPEWLKHFSWFKPWKNIWFGVSVKDDQDFEVVIS